MMPTHLDTNISSLLFPTLRFCARCIVLGCASGILTGCAGNYSGKSQVVREYYMTGQVDQALAELDKMSELKQDKDLTSLEKGNLLLAFGRPEESEQVFGSVIEPYITTEDNKPVINLTGVGGNVSATVIGDDRSIKYRVPGHEMVMAMKYRAMAFLFMGRL